MNRGIVTLAALLALGAGIAPVATRAATPAPRMMGWSDADIADRVLPSVVNITVEKIVKDPRGAGNGKRETFFGSGFIIDPSGLIVTNRHVIEGSVWITVGFSDRSEVQAELIAACGLTDVAVLKVDAGHRLPALKFADSDKVRVGDPVLAVGNPLGVGTSVSSGIVSALNRDIMESPFDDDIQTDAAINHGNSGGPLIDRDGEVIGLNTALTALSPNGGSIGLGYAIPSDDVSYVVHILLEPDPKPPGWSGARVQDVTADLARAFGLNGPLGFIVTGTDPDSPARAAGLHSGDIILRYGDMQPSDSRALIRAIAMTPPGRNVTLTIWRSGAKQVVPLTVAGWPNMVIERGSMMASMASAKKAEPQSLGFALAPATEAVRKRFSLASTEGVLVTQVDSNAEAFDRGVAPGDVIVKVQDTVVTSPDQVQALVDGARARQQVVAMLVAGKSGARWVTLYFGTSRPGNETRGLTASAGPGEPAAQSATGAVRP
ncbi:MAG: trypsin-like peptidase domain-containing protein [Acetobacteraceae bacterium]